MELILQELFVLKTMNIKPNYSALARKHGMSRNTIRRYDNGYRGKPDKKKKVSVLDKYNDVIKEKLSIPGVRISSVYRYFYEKDNSIGTESNFRKYVKAHDLTVKQKIVGHPRYETEKGFQLQFDFKEDIRMISRQGEIFDFHILTSVLGYSRKHVFEYTKSKSRAEVKRCLTNTFTELGGVPMTCLTDNMASIVSGKYFVNEYIEFAKDFGFNPKKCKVRTPETKGKVESKNRFLNWLKPYHMEFETEKELIEIIKNIEAIANNKVNATTGVSPNLLFENTLISEHKLNRNPINYHYEDYRQLLGAATGENDDIDEFTTQNLKNLDSLGGGL